jgi:NTP pyrophosphatase (non-canonical NTP hydrolase)
MRAEEYQLQCLDTSKYQSIETMFLACVLGAASEAGELAGKLEKKIRKHGVWMPETQEEKDLILHEIGDALYFLTLASFSLRTDLSEVMQMNLDKLKDREKRGTIHGVGDKR